MAKDDLAQTDGADETVEFDPAEMVVTMETEQVHGDLVECGLIVDDPRPRWWDMLDVWAEWPENLAA